jgi:hypothetical protein
MRFGAGETRRFTCVRGFLWAATPVADPCRLRARRATLLPPPNKTLRGERATDQKSETISRHSPKKENLTPLTEV